MFCCVVVFCRVCVELRGEYMELMLVFFLFCGVCVCMRMVLGDVVCYFFGVLVLEIDVVWEFDFVE